MNMKRKQNDIRLCRLGQASWTPQKRISFRVWCALMCWLVAGCASIPEQFNPEDPIDPAAVSHRVFDRLLRTSVEDGLVDYPAFQTSPEFATYLNQLNRVDPASFRTPGERLAFWINAYNAFAIQGILDGESPAPYVGWYRYFKLRTYAVGGAEVTLYDLEHEVLRKQFKEPRVHFAIVCASASCPKLQSWAYDAAELDRQLDAVTRAFINDPTRNRFDRLTKVARLSKIFDWFEEDFAMEAGSVLQFVARYVNDEHVAGDLAAGAYRIEYLEYDWSLNGIPPGETDAGPSR
jgi:hypothetical protein